MGGGGDDVDDGDGVALVRYLIVLPANPQTRGVLRLMLAKLKMKATNKTDMAAINTHMMDWYGWVGSAIQNN
jgi:hypothetical protein